VDKIVRAKIFYQWNNTMKHLSRFFCLFILSLVLLLAGCSLISNQAAEPRVGSIQMDDFTKDASGENLFFSIPVDQAMLDKGNTINIQAAGEISSGQLHVILRDPQEQPAWDPGGFGGVFSANTYFRPTRTGTYRLGANWTNGTRGSIRLSYQADTLSPLVLIPGLGMILVALAFILYASRRRDSSRAGWWGYLGLGALAWTITVAGKFILSLSLNQTVYKALFQPDHLWAPGSILFYLYVGVLTGITGRNDLAAAALHSPGTSFMG
jgi:hypothetical protein